MPCCLGVVALLFPRTALVIMWLASYTTSAFETVVWPLLGFFFMPYATCAYAIAMNEFGGTQGVGLALVVVAAVIDLGAHGGSARGGRRYRRRLLD